MTKNPDKIKSKSKKYYIENKDNIKIKVKLWAEKNPDKIFQDITPFHLKKELNVNLRKVCLGITMESGKLITKNLYQNLIRKPNQVQ